METTLDRIKQFIDFKGITIHAFEKKIDVSNGSISSQLKNNRTIGVDKLEKILNTYKELNPTWVLTGVGEMIITNTKSKQKPIKTPFNQSLNTNDVELLKELLSTKDGLINSQQETITAQQKLIKELEDKIKLSK